MSARPPQRLLAAASSFASSSSFNALYLIPIVGGALLLVGLALWFALAIRRRRAAKGDADTDPQRPAPAVGFVLFHLSSSERQFDSGGGYVSMAMTDSQRTASSLFTGSSRGQKQQPTTLAHDYDLPPADADRLYAVLQRDAALAGRRVSFDKIAFDTVTRRRAASSARRVWLCQYEGEEMDVTQLVLVAPSSAAARVSVTSPRGLQALRGLSSSSSSVSATLSPSAASGNALLPLGALLPQVQQFVREIRLVGSLRHPHVVPFVGVAWSALSNLSLVTEHLAHGDLRLVLKRHRRDAGFSWRTHKLRIALGVARALVYLHAQSLADAEDPLASPRPVVYQGLRASSVGLTSELEPQLADFSAAAAEEATPRSETLAAGGGDAFWLAPEVLSGAGSRATRAADVYAFGVLLSELDSGGKSPFHRELRRREGAADAPLRPFQVLHGVASGELRPALRPDCPAHVRAIARACVAQEPAQRPSAARVCELLMDAEKAAPTTWAGAIV